MRFWGKGWAARNGAVAAMLLLAAAGPAVAQRGGGGVPTRPAPAPMRDLPVRSGVIDDIERRQALRRAEAAEDAAAARREGERTQTERVEIARTYDRDIEGRWYRKGEILLATADPGATEAAKALGLTELRSDRLAAAGVTLHVFSAPPGKATETAFKALRAARPDDAIDLNFIYVFEAARQGRVTPLTVAAQGGGGSSRYRMAAVIDTALPQGGLPGVIVRSERFAPGPSRASAHAQAVAQVLADTAGREGLVIFAADVSEPGPLPGASAAAIAKALDWAAASRADVINVSLTGPPNATLALVVRRIAARGIVIVAAAGNDGPRAPAPYPAALPEVLGVTAVDDRQRIWRRATQGPHVDFAARGVKVAVSGGEWTGTSLAAPVVAGLLLRPGVTPATLLSSARDLGQPGRDPVYGDGFVSAP